MSEQNAFPAWTGPMLDAQRQFWDAWADMARRSFQGESAVASQSPLGSWSEVFERWTRGLGVQTPRGVGEPLERMLEQGQSFVRLGEEVTRLMSGMSEASRVGADWQKELTSMFEQYKRFMSGREVSEGLQGLVTFSSLPLDTFSRVLSGMSMGPGDFMTGLKPLATGAVDESLEREFKRFLSVPAVGYTRESQEQAQEGMRLLLDHQQAMQAYVAAHGRVGLQTVDRLLGRLVEKGENNETVQTLRQFYDLCVDVAEEVFAEFAMTEEYARLYGDLVNTLMAVKRHGQKVIDETLASFNMPTRRELDTQLSRMQELRRALRALESRSLEHASPATSSEVAAGAIEALQGHVERQEADRQKVESALRQEIDSLRRDLVALRASVVAASAPPQHAEPVAEAPAEEASAPAAGRRAGARGRRSPSTPK